MDFRTNLQRREFAKLVFLGGAGAGLGLAAWPEARAAQRPPQRGGTLVVGTAEAPRHLNGAVQSGLATALPSTQLFASPLRFDDAWNPQPYLAESWQLAPDGLSLTLQLRKNAVFHDGKPITSDDVAFSIMAIKANHPFVSMLAPVEKVDTPDAHTAIVRMHTPHPAIILAMSPALCPILPRHVYGSGGDLKDHPRNAAQVVGSGPFKLVEFKPGQRVVMERFDGYFLEGRPYLDKLVMDIAPDASTLMLNLQRGTVDMRPFVSRGTELKAIADDGKLAMTAKGYEGVGPLNLLAFNLERRPVSDVRVRKAIATAIDQKFITGALMNGFAKPAQGPIVPSSPFASADLVRYPTDLKKAAAMLDAAGLPATRPGERFRLTLDYNPGDDQQKTVAEYLRAQLKKVDIAVDVRAAPDFPTWARRMAARDYDMTVDGVFNWGDPIIGVHRTYLSSNIRPVVWTNTQAFRNAEVDRLLEMAGRAVDTAERKAHYAAFQKIVTDELPVHPLSIVPYHTVTQKRVGNVPDSIWGPLSPYDEVFVR